MGAAEPGMPAWAGQGEYSVRFQWGPVAAAALSDGVSVVVDVLRFTTAVEAAVSRGAVVYPYRWRDATAAAFAESLGALLAGGRDPAGPSVSPSGMAALPYGASLVLPSPNGATCTLLAAGHFGELAVWEGRNAAPPQLAHLGDEEDRDRQGDDGHPPTVGPLRCRRRRRAARPARRPQVPGPGCSSAAPTTNSRLAPAGRHALSDDPAGRQHGRNEARAPASRATH
jgi:hypothetical protein